MQLKCIITFLSTHYSVSKTERIVAMKIFFTNQTFSTTFRIINYTLTTLLKASNFQYKYYCRRIKAAKKIFVTN